MRSLPAPPNALSLSPDPGVLPGDDSDGVAIAQLHELLSQHSTPMRMLAGNHLFSRGDEADSFYLLEEGAREGAR